MEMPYGGQIYGPGSPLARQVLAVVRPLVRYFPYEIQVEGATVPHAILEIAAISYLMGRFGLPFAQARRIVESWEVNEMFPGAARISQGEEHA
ncbi:hypothetical protein EFBL_0560 [Effusibacillus lacus]|uniref:Uncharacterized protein n=2 Tax=Effusibacillus lacus TaxID=1348429 RepID=A0A292YIK3_9BACL|nr:hypothetical protein EFBL_0560 [Effusibacillus lacus]